MSPSKVPVRNAATEAAGSDTPAADVAVETTRARIERRDARRWWTKLILQPALFVALSAISIVSLGVAQRFGFLSSGGEVTRSGEVGDNSRFICPMMCTPPQTSPGRCPVCAMELVAAASGGGAGGSLSIQLDPAARRLAKIETAEVQEVPASRTFRAIGEVSYDEGAIKTISAYVGGRLDRLLADYTGVVVVKGDRLALLYSPQLYSGQVELLSARNARNDSRSATLKQVIETNRQLYEKTRERLIEWGMTDEQLENLERDGQANSRLHLCASISGTVIEKLAVEGQYVKEGQPIYKLADLSSVWLMLELFPEDAAAIRYGQRVEAEVQSLPGKKFTGRVAFLDPNVDVRTRTVGVRVVIANPDGRLRIGDYAKATIEAPLTSPDDRLTPVYDPELADKWISPRHPHIIASSPGKCRLCEVDLVPASQFGFTNVPDDQLATIIPRNAVLMAGDNSVVYVESERGRFELRRVVLGPGTGDDIVILQGLERGERVATRGNFLIDSQMQLAGNPSLIDPTRALAKPDNGPAGEVEAALAAFDLADRELAKKQLVCPITDAKLGSMGAPIKVDVNGTPVFICCAGCRDPLLKTPVKFLQKLAAAAVKTNESSGDTDLNLPPIGDIQLVESLEPETPAAQEVKIATSLGKLPEQLRSAARRQAICPVTDEPLGSMGIPVKVDVNGRPVFICCEGCRKTLLTQPQKYLAKIHTGVLR